MIFRVPYWSQQTTCIRCGAPVYIKFRNNDLYLIDCNPKHSEFSVEPRPRMFEDGKGVEHAIICPVKRDETLS